MSLSFKKTGPTSGGAITFKTGRWEVPGSILGCACQPSRSDLPLVSPETRVNTNLDPLEKLPTEGTPPRDPGPTSGQLDLNLQLDSK